MPNKQLITVGLTDLATSDVEGLRSTFEQDIKVYMWVKNGGSTGLLAPGHCLEIQSSVEAGLGRVVSPDSSVPTKYMLLGKPCTAIAPSGSATGDHGWVQVRGLARVDVAQLTTALVAGTQLMATSALPATYAWQPTDNIDTDAAAVGNVLVNLPHAILMHAVATTGAATTVRALVYIMCR